MIYDVAADAMRRFQELGVAVEALQKALTAAHAARIGTTANDAPQIPGTYAWGAAVRTLRDELCPRGWRKADPHNFSLVVNDSRRINIAVESGDALTRIRRPDMAPRTKSVKGLYVEAAALRNRIEGDLFPETLSEDLRKVAAILEYPTYIFLIYTTDTEYRAELSLPDEVDDKQIVSWKKRIFVPDTDDPLKERKPVPGEDLPDIDIPVRRKA
jgi:hypothetical protein